MIIPHSKPMIDNEDLEAVREVLASRHIAQGGKVSQFEARLADFVGTKYGAAVSSGTAAIHLGLKSLKVKTNDEVILPSYVCASPYMAILHTGARPRIVDIDISDFNISTAEVQKSITSRTKAIIVPHIFGTPAEIDELLDFEIPIIEDCAQSIGAQYKKKNVGSFGRLSICSFYATKMIATGEGGMVLTNDLEIYENVLAIREYDEKPLDRARYNYKMSDIQAALGLSQLSKITHFIKRRRSIAAIYTEEFSKSNAVLPPAFPHKESVFYRYVILADKMKLIQKSAKKDGIICERPIWEPLHKNFQALKCSNSDFVYDRALSIPLYPSLTDSEVEYVTRTLQGIFTNL